MEENIFSSPATMKAAIGKEVRITTLNGVTEEGYVYVIDPITKTVVLTDSTGVRLCIILHHAIKRLELGHKQEAKYALRDFPHNTQSGRLEEKKRKLAKWLKDHLINVVEDGDSLRISDCVSVEPPYDSDHCYCTNTVILERFRGIINRMPQ